MIRNSQYSTILIDKRPACEYERRENTKEANSYSKYLGGSGAGGYNLLRNKRTRSSCYKSQEAQKKKINIIVYEIINLVNIFVSHIFSAHLFTKQSLIK